MKKVKMPEVFTSAAKNLQTKFKNPFDLLEQTTRALGWIHSYEMEKKDRKEIEDPHFEIVIVITDVLIPLAKGDTTEIAKGILELYKWSSDEDLYHRFCDVRIAHAKHSQQFGAPSEEMVERDEIVFRFLLEIYYSILVAKDAHNIKEQIMNYDLAA